MVYPFLVLFKKPYDLVLHVAIIMTSLAPNNGISCYNVAVVSGLSQ